ncbi:alpha/beta hydrolase [Serratia ficaria]|jgi:pimeloyl-ACP methyl ester carboxylesterase|uniref:3-oxoadipate enol-lactonase 2 n=1 Tax=Serratia ficaria TaxID=61651 RepID=A0A240C3Z7_SERFI|nr:MULTISPECIES: alpha/beta hydrolase [Serratia]MEE4482086.1 alpha/beta hydrolase [Serratia ficaria]REF44594.1 pimeloyl-ACP methyl ester carboxylesterase [Serratia ficaria]CAI0715564.1 3-oxoadipate enol-lactonase 2 [Serratia ficaria]CAI0759898.1 3-oxoadipate enol-lactonase 2 [Serratia ficaria]CAI0792034.1 3-oxoadipate enol-lactonase 2 [Serratia ficaria]
MNEIEIRRGVTEQGDVPIAYEDWGAVSHPPLLLIMGIGAQMLLWPDDFCRALVAKGFRVIRFDNRDVGLSGKTQGQRRMPLWLLMLRAQLGWQTAVPYTLADMAADAVRLLDHLQIPQAHVLGASMGGMIAQVLAAEYPQRVRSLTILFSSTNQPLLPPPAPSLLLRLLRRPPAEATQQQRQQAMKDFLRALGTRSYPLDEAELDLLVRRLLKRGVEPEGMQRQLSALLGSGDLRRYSRKISAPTLVIHGEADRLVRKAGGVAIARAVANARLHTIPGMGHDLPPQLRPRLIALIAEHAAEPCAGRGLQ